jgi:hypothetical protein
MIAEKDLIISSILEDFNLQSSDIKIISLGKNINFTTDKVRFTCMFEIKEILTAVSGNSFRNLLDEISLGIREILK